MTRLFRHFSFLALSALLCFGAAAESIQVEIDWSHPHGSLRPLHGINKGPLLAGGLLDLTAAQTALGIPFNRLHDCHWPNPEVVDMHVVFPNPAAELGKAESYDFALTDDYIAATRATGAQIIYRLGESIEHTKTKRFVHPPKDMARWAESCLGVIRHYNEGWANGFRYGIQYWEIWNEPENRPVMWSGTDEDYFKLYVTAARAIKAHDPKLKVGGPAVGYSGRFVKGVFEPSAFVTNFLARCRSENVALDFFSWHCYTADPDELVQRAKAIRQLLDQYGAAKTESHLNEWNYLPGNSWNGASKTATPEARQAYYDEMSGASGAAFVAVALMKLQAAPLDVANLFHGEAGNFGLFNENGVPTKNYHAVRAFHELMETPLQVESKSGNATSLAGVNAARNSASVLLSTMAAGKQTVELKWAKTPWPKRSALETFIVDAAGGWRRTPATLLAAPQDGAKLEFTGPGVALIKLRPE